MENENRVYDEEGDLLGTVYSYMGNVDRKVKGRRVVESRRTVKLWAARPVTGRAQHRFRTYKDAVSFLEQLAG